MEEIKLCSDCGRPLWEEKCLYGKGFLDGFAEGRLYKEKKGKPIKNKKKMLGKTKGFRLVEEALKNI